jgi:3-oxoacyl-[acyl-carrier-protein] synthase III
MASLLIDSGQCDYVLVVGTELNSRVVDWKDRNTCVLFGDGAGAVVMGRGAANQGMIHSQLRSDGTQAAALYIDSIIQDGKRAVNMDGKQVFKTAVNEVSAIVLSTLAQAGFSIADLDLLVMHQANIRIINAISEKLGLPPEKVVINVDRFGNTSAATVPLALYDAEQQGRLKPGQLVALAAVGGGMSWGCNLFRW